MDLSNRIKGYETASEQVLPARLPVILRLDGNSFSKLTSRKDFNKPFDPQFDRAMIAAAVRVMDYCSGGQVAYVQSDEISVLLRNNMRHGTEPFLANRTQKIASLCAALASVAFNKANGDQGIDTEAIFDCRVFVLPPSEVVNYFLWRQQDCFKNFISSYAYHELRKLRGRKTAQKMLHGKSIPERQDVILQELGVNINDLPTYWKRGRCIYREARKVPLKDTFEDPDRLRHLVETGHIEDPDRIVTRTFWKIDEEIPLFNEDRDYLEIYLQGTE